MPRRQDLAQQAASPSEFLPLRRRSRPLRRAHPLRRSRPPRRRRCWRPHRAVLPAVAALTLAVACAGSADPIKDNGTAPVVQLGYVANLTHAAAIVGADRRFLRDALGGTELRTQIFEAGPTTVEALFAEALDVAYLGPTPAINAFGQSEGEAVRIIAGATSGGAQLVVRPGIDSAQELRGTMLATPQLGNTQDIALRAWLTEHGLRNSVRGSGDVIINPTKNANALQLFRDGELDGAWLPEPWASLLVLQTGAKVLVDEKDLWADGRFVTTHLLVRTEFLQRYPQTVEALLRGHVDAVQWITNHPEEAKHVVNAGLADRTGRRLPPHVLDRAWRNLTVTVDPIATSLQRNADDAVTAGVADERVDLRGIYDLSIVNRILTERGLPIVSSGGLGKE